MNDEGQTPASVLATESICSKKMNKMDAIFPAVPGMSPGKGRKKEQEADGNGEMFERMIEVE